MVLHKTIKELHKVEQPRERLMKYGADKLSSAELLAILLRTGKKGLNVLELAEKVLRKVGEENFSNLKIEDLKGISGLGPVKSCEIIACFELGKRLLKDKKIHIYLKPRDVWNE